MKSTLISNRTIFLVYLALMFLLLATYATAHVDLGILNTPVSLSIAALKAVLVALFFMHLRYQRGIARVAAIAGLLWLGILMTLALSDFNTRNWLLLPGHWPETQIRLSPP